MGQLVEYHPDQTQRTIRYWLNCDYDDVRAGMRKALAGDDPDGAEFMVALGKVPEVERNRLFAEAKRA